MNNQYLHIKSKELSFKAKLLWDDAPETCEAILKILPLTGKLMQTRWSGFGVWIDLGEVEIDGEDREVIKFPDLESSDLLGKPIDAFVDFVKWRNISQL